MHRNLQPFSTILVDCASRISLITRICASSLARLLLAKGLCSTICLTGLLSRPSWRLTSGVLDTLLPKESRANEKLHEVVAVQCVMQVSEGVGVGQHPYRGAHQGK